MNKEEYIVLTDSGYYAGEGDYPGSYRNTAKGPCYAEKMSAAEATSISERLRGSGHAARPERYDPVKYLSQCIERGISLEYMKEDGKNVGNAIKANMTNTMKYINQIGAGH